MVKKKDGDKIVNDFMMTRLKKLIAIPVEKDIEKQEYRRGIIKKIQDKKIVTGTITLFTFLITIIVIL